MNNTNTDPLAEAIEAAIWERYEGAEPSATGLVLANPRTIAAVAAAEARAAVLPSVDRAVLREAAHWFDSGSRSVSKMFGHQAAAELRRMADEAQQPGSYETTTGHLITCLTVAGGEADPDCSCAAKARHYAVSDETRPLCACGRFWPCPLADEAQQQETPSMRPRRGDQFEAWLKEFRDACAGQTDEWHAFDAALDRYRLHADTGTPLGEHVCEGQAVGDCECLEQPAAGARQDRAQNEPAKEA
ncbi:hypothetical protein K4749_01155 [Streptomyces sp. TRM72054]|uniref:hypothetical protein n=1 Tax=Streptomyces sp. TRM72054 TaxID=2870562 RepID=UPI001C8B754A|nr:hypothetical protein [Streptomyces sp. TRM72054]MBX9392238.1 hypothetical protein [Streptomyces sp. TRM72054]